MEVRAYQSWQRMGHPEDKENKSWARFAAS
jgi:hypothetical protein